MTARSDQHICQNEACLINCIRKGDERALSVLFEKYAPLCYGLLLRKGMELQKAEALLHGVFMKIWAGITSGEFKGQFLFPWIMTLLRNSSNEETTLTNAPIHNAAENVNDKDLLNFILFSGLNINEAAKQLNTTPKELMLRIRAALALKKTVTTE